MKPRVMSLVVFTALVGMVVAPGPLHPVLGFVALLCIAIGAGASGALNMWYDADIDAVMTRTTEPPDPGRPRQPGEALGFGVTLALGSVVVLGLVANLLAAALLAFTIFFYAVVYTMWLKRSTPQNIVIGGAAGAFPPMIGWAAATGAVSLESVVLFPSSSSGRRRTSGRSRCCEPTNTARAGIPMLPVTAGRAETRRQILLYSLLLAPLGVAPWRSALPGWSMASSRRRRPASFLALALRLYRAGDGPRADAAAKSLFGYSILYLFMLFAVMLVENRVMCFPGVAGA